jgi:hypothetical protein
MRVRGRVCRIAKATAKRATIIDKHLSLTSSSTKPMARRFENRFEMKSNGPEDSMYGTAARVTRLTTRHNLSTSIEAHAHRASEMYDRSKVSKLQISTTFTHRIVQNAPLPSYP